MKIKFLGAAGTVTGSKYLLSTHDKKYLVDCGLFQGLKNLRLRNWDADYIDKEASSLEAIFLTHAHIDHSGYIPRLVNKGFRGPIYCSQATFELVKIMLPDSGHLQEEEAEYANKKGYSKHKPALPLYTFDEALESLRYFQPVDFHKKFNVAHDAQVLFSRAGHILGASCIFFEAQNRRIIFSGDVGRYVDLIMKAPEPLADADYLVIESTYGDRAHGSEDVFKQIATIINNSIKNNGTIIIPAFAVGRAQHILYIISELKKARRIPDIKTYLDSPMAINTTDLYCQFISEHRLSKENCKEMCSMAVMTRSAEESRALNDIVGPKIIISASGMASGGRVIHHLARYIGDEKNTVILVGFQAAGTRGRALLDGAAQLKIFGESFEVKARIAYIPGLSAHADAQELIRWLNDSSLKHPRVFVTHGEEEAARALKDIINKRFQWRCEIPVDGEEYEL
jgi:metallo-beta-lactamase family protein